MKVTNRTIWRIAGCEYDHYLLQAAEEILSQAGATGGINIVDVCFGSREAAIEVAKLILLKYAQMTPWAHSCGFAKVADEVEALRELGLAPATRWKASCQPAQWVSVPALEVNSTGTKVRMTRELEVQWKLSNKVQKTIEVAGETWTREVEEAKTSSWYPGLPAINEIDVWSGVETHIEID